MGSISNSEMSNPWNCFTPSDLESTIKVLEAIHNNPDLKRTAAVNEDMKRLMIAIQKHSDPWKERRREKRKRESEDVEATGIRKLRRKGTFAHGSPSNLVGINDAPAIVDPLVDYGSTSPSPVAGASSSFNTKKTRLCHICLASFTKLHHFYDRLCPSCASFNYFKRSSLSDMSGRVCLVTGGRIKIGFQIALQLLRANAATVIVTSRFPNDTATRYEAEPDYESFKGRLVIYGVDFRGIGMVKQFCLDVKRKFDRLDVLINNAAQTVRRPPAFYEHLLAGESTRKILDGVEVLVAHDEASGFEFKKLEHVSTRLLESGVSQLSNKSSTFLASTDNALVHESTKYATIGSVNISAALSQVPLIAEDHLSPVQKVKLFPPGKYDSHGQQVDYRLCNSWVQQIEQVDTIEMMECHAINAFAPWILIQELKCLLLASPNPDRYIVNVSAMEGQFYRLKSTYHPHTNMAKASLNMLTRTAAAGFKDDGIFMTAVDTGWVTNESPLKRGEEETRAQPPLDELDGAMRVLDPVFSGVRGEDKVWGVFLKNYQPTKW